MEIQKNTRIAEVIRKHPETKPIFEKYNMACLSCLGLKEESIEKGAIMHGLDTDDFIKELQSAVK
jgi:hybrid cluster-associated redox disulfide protein